MTKDENHVPQGTWGVFDTWQHRWSPTPPIGEQAARERAAVLNVREASRGGGQGCTRYEARCLK